MRGSLPWFRRHEAGSSLIEVLIAAALLSALAVGLFQGLAVVSKSDIVVSGLSEGESLARSELEYLRTTTYIDYLVEDHPEYGTISLPADYTLDLAVTPMSVSTGEPLESAPDQGLQRISVTVRYRGEPVTTLAGYRTNQ